MQFLFKKSFFNKILYFEKFKYLIILLELIFFCFLWIAIFFQFYGLCPSLLLIILWLVILNKFLVFFQNIEPKNSLEDFLENPEDFNVFDFFDYRTFKAIRLVLKKSQKLKLNEVPYPIVAFYSLSALPKNFKRFILARTLLDLEKYTQELKNFITGVKREESAEIDFKNLEQIFISSAHIALRRGHRRIRLEDIFCSLVYFGPFLKNYLVSEGLKPKDIERIFDWYLRIEKRIKARKELLSFDNLIRIGSIGKDWASGFTPTLDAFSYDWTSSIRGVDFEDFPGHNEELRQIERILSKKATNNDVLLVGVPGSFRRNILRKLALKMALGKTDKSLNFKRLVELKLGLLINEVQSKEGLEKVLSRVFYEVVHAGNIILVIHNFHTYFDKESGLGTAEISGVLTQFLRTIDFRLIGITTYRDYYGIFDKKVDFLTYFEKLEVDEFNEDETLLILENRAMILENEYKKLIPYKTLRDIIYYSEKYLADIPFPQKALNLLEEAVIYSAQSVQSPLVLSEHVAKIVQQKTEIPVGKIEEEERKKLLDLEQLIHQHIINQEEAVVKISDALRRSRSEISIKKGPIGAFLFLGPTGVGKTETAKAMARIYFGGEDRIIRFDMSEFQKKEDIDRLIGSVRERGRLVQEIKNNPFSLLLLDEVEKAHPDILNLFLQVLDEGYCHDAFGQKVSFEHSMIIATSNAGYKIILDAVLKNRNFDKIEVELLDYLFEQGTFRPEFINRFDDAIIFKPLTRENLIDISGLLLSKLQKNLRSKDITFFVSEEIKQKIVDIGYNPIFGAREMKRVIQNKIENEIAEGLLREEIKPGDNIKISPVDFKISKVEN